MSNYVNLLCKEIATAAKQFSAAAPATPLGGGGRSDDDPVVLLHTVYFGGGTPSLLPVPLLQRVISELKTHFQFASDAEISMEMDPGTFDSEKLAGFLESGVTRVSLGVQSFNPELLQACGRAHGLQEVYDAVDAIKSSGLKNWSLDLMASLPNQTPQQWEHSLSEAVSLGPAHVSVYDLQIEEGTLFHRWFKAGQEPLPSDERSAELYRSASRVLREAGFEHYEVSNYAKPGFQSRHNLVYWENRPYYAFGLGSTSYVKGRRFSRPRKFKGYATYVDELEKESMSRPGIESFNVAQNGTTSLEDEVLDTVMLSLRLARGLDLMEFDAKFGSVLTSTVCTTLVPFVEAGVVEVLDAQRQTLEVGLYIQDWKDKDLPDGQRQNHEMGLYIQDWIDTDRNVDVVGGNGFSAGADEGRASVGGYEHTRLTKMEDSRVLQQEWVSFERRPKFVRLSDPDGFLISNEVISSIFAALPSVGGH